jgi:23S rRNA (adenine2503-C2)-methyltransferase
METTDIELRGLFKKCDAELSAGDILPTWKKWILVLSSQYGCPFKCLYCDVQRFPFQGNVSAEDIIAQYLFLRGTRPDIRFSDELKVSFSRFGEPLLNWRPVREAIIRLKLDYTEGFNYLPALITICPTNCWESLEDALEVKNSVFNGYFHIQHSINSTSEEQRKWIFGGAPVATLQDIGSFYSSRKVVGRRITLNFIATTGFDVNPEVVARLCSPELFTVKISGLNRNYMSVKNGLQELASYREPAKIVELADQFTKLGFRTIKTVLTERETESRLHCGAALPCGTSLACGSSLQCGSTVC